MEPIQVKNRAMLEALVNHENGEIAYIEDEETYLMYNDGVWQEIPATATSNGIQLNLYDINKQVVSQLPNFNDEAWDGAEVVVNDFLTFKHGDFFMLYGREINYFTIFQKVGKNGEFKSLFKAIRECLDNVGDVRSFDLTEDGGAIEIWVANEDDVTCMYLFDYTQGVVTYND